MNKPAVRNSIGLVIGFIFLCLMEAKALASCIPNVLNSSLTSIATLDSNATGDCISNTGIITISSDGIYSTGNESVITNSGSINATRGVISRGDYSTINNMGIISASFEGIRITGNYNNLINSGVDIVTSGFAGLELNGSYANINNTATGVISGTYGIFVNSGNNAITNNGTITGYGYGIRSTAYSNIITNNGSISSINSYGIYFDGPSNTNTLNNAQGGNSQTIVTTALTLSGTLPAHYNIIIDNAEHYGQLLVRSASGSMTFGIYAGSNVNGRFYGNVLSNVIGYVNITHGVYDNMTWTLVPDGNNYDLTFAGVSLTQTQASIAQSAQALRGVYDLQNVSINNNLNNDCTLFDVHDICTSVTGAQNYLSGGVNNDTTSGTLNVAYRINENVRIGAYLDQNLNTTNVTGVHLNNGSPAFGAFAVWNTNSDGLGTQLRVSAGYADKDMTVTRQVMGTSEAGSGTTSLKSYGASIVGSYAMAMPGNFVFSPYAGLRYTKVTANGYTEASSDYVTAPLTYSALTQNAATAIVGARWTKPIQEHAVAYASLGLEQDLNNNGGTYTASGVDGLSSIAFNANINRTRPTASIGSYYNLGDRQRIAANLVWSEEAFTTNNATSLMVTYTAGF